MKIYKVFAIIGTMLLIISCGDNSGSKKEIFTIKIQNQKKSYRTSDVVSVLVNNKENKTVDSIEYLLNSERLSSSTEIKETKLPLINQKLGRRSVTAKIYSEGDIYEAIQDITILSSVIPKLYAYKILETYPHDIEAYTQGLEFENDTLYESTGQYKKSSLRKTNLETGEVLKKVPLANSYFGEGLTIMNNKIYQLTYKENTGFIYNLDDLTKTGTFVYGKSKEGWGLCNDGKTIYKSDGTEKIWSLNASTLAEEDYIEIYTNTSRIPKVNELEWVNGKIFANVYQQGSIAIVDPSNGAVEGVIDLTDLKDQVTQHEALDVLNGIAYNGEENILYITGKNWDKMFKIEVFEKR